MSGEVKQNTSVATGVIATAPSATQSASDPVYNTNPEDVGAEWHNTTSGEIFISTSGCIFRLAATVSAILLLSAFSF